MTEPTESASGHEAPPTGGAQPTGPGSSGPTADAMRLRETALMASAQRLSGLGAIRNEDISRDVIRDAEIYLAWLEE